MTAQRKAPPLAIFPALFSVLFLVLSAWPCTIAVVSGRATADGRPLLWKNRDVDEQDNLLKFYRGQLFDYLGLAHVSQTDSVWGGLNSSGFAVVNSVSYDLEGSSSGDNGRFMKQALESCATVDDFEALLQATNSAGRRTQANFGVIDASGGAAVFETGNTSYTRFEAKDEPSGYIIRTNFALTGVRPEEGSGFVRFDRARLLMAAVEEGSLDAPTILEQAARDLVNDMVDPYPLPYEGSQEGHPVGYIRTQYSINRYRTASCLLIHGVRTGENPILSTLWCILGEPVCGVALPLWVHAGSVPAEQTGSQTAPMRDLVLRREGECYTDASNSQYLDTLRLVSGDGRGMMVLARAVEDTVFLAAEHALESWRSSSPTAGEAAEFQALLSSWTYQTLSRWSWF
ncbi:MAG: hypothetical protein A2Y56_09105 [Candidatus Aminicenantes bacterium RBG_13_63_10]|nr:MAG: hypothetical protein A2Y56_09105 [Candidatus Aminicenantes bacterium RBG_13_63_10]